jgi:hypothetical protein
MLTFEEGNIFDSEAQVLVNPVNCLGVRDTELCQKADLLAIACGKLGLVTHVERPDRELQTAFC